jgi:hypothetical protein
MKLVGPCYLLHDQPLLRAQKFFRYGVELCRLKKAQTEAKRAHVISQKGMVVISVQQDIQVWINETVELFFINFITVPFGNDNSQRGQSSTR